MRKFVECAPEPAAVDVRHARLLADALDDRLGLLFGADDDNGAARGNGVADEVERLLQKTVVFSRSMMLTPLRSEWMYGCIFGWRRAF